MTSRIKPLIYLRTPALGGKRGGDPEALPRMSRKGVLLNDLRQAIGTRADHVTVTGAAREGGMVTLSVRLPFGSLSEDARMAVTALL
jgi:hypothetical protein